MTILVGNNFEKALSRLVNDPNLKLSELKASRALLITKIEHYSTI